MDADELAAYTGLPAPQSHRLIDFAEASVQHRESSPPQAVLRVRGTAPYPGMHITLEPVMYLRQPEFWRIEVVGRLLEPAPPRPTSYEVQRDLADPMGTRGIEVAGATRVAQLVLVDDQATNPPASRVLLRGTVKDAGGWPLGKVPVVGRSPAPESDLDAIVTTDPEGRYTMQLPGPGRYHISTEAAGFADALAELEVSGGLPARQDFYLTPLPALRDSILEEQPAPAEEEPVAEDPVPVPELDDDSAQVVEPTGDDVRPEPAGEPQVVEGTDQESPPRKRARKATGASGTAPRSRRRNTST